MLRSVRDEIVRNYFDEKFRGVDMDAKYKQADEILKKIGSNSEAFLTIAAFAASLDDSHTRFSPPTRSVKYEHGWRMKMIGDKCFVVDVDPESNADKQGLKEGDQILSIEGFIPTRADFDKIRYVLYYINPLPDFNIIVQSHIGDRRKLLVQAKRTEGMRITDLTNYDQYMNLVRKSETQARNNAHRFTENGKDTIVWKMPQFDLTVDQVDDQMGKVSKRQNLIMDLRGNGGGSEITLMRLLGHFFSEDVKVGELVRRKETKPLVAKSVNGKIFNGKVVVLIDSESGSAAEVFARVMQLKQRGTVVGDKSSGKVMRSRFYSKKVGIDVVVFYGVSVTDADLIMDDGKSLEKIGVTPDHLELPTPLDLRDNKDPVLSYALSLVGSGSKL